MPTQDAAQAAPAVSRRDHHRRTDRRPRRTRARLLHGDPRQRAGVPPVRLPAGPGAGDH